MSRTIRIYNRRHRYRLFFHPYWQVCMGHCSRCKASFKAEARKRRRQLRQLYRSEIEASQNGPGNEK